MPGFRLDPSVAEVVLRLARPRRLHESACQAEGDDSAGPLVHVPALRGRAASGPDGGPHGATEDTLPSLLEELQRVPDFRRAQRGGESRRRCWPSPGGRKVRMLPVAATVRCPARRRSATPRLAPLRHWWANQAVAAYRPHSHLADHAGEPVVEFEPANASVRSVTGLRNGYIGCQSVTELRFRCGVAMVSTACRTEQAGSS